MKAYIALLLSASLSTAFCQTKFEFKGVPIGASKAELLSKIPSLECKKPIVPTIADEVCSPGYECRSPECMESRRLLQTYAGGGYSEISLHLVNGRLEGVWVEFPYYRYEQVRDAIKSVYGAGQEERETVQNTIGNSFESRMFTVSGITIAERATKVTEGALNYSSKALQDWRSAQQAKRAPSNGKDL